MTPVSELKSSSPGLLLCSVVGVIAFALSGWTSVPVMMLALLSGLALGSLTKLNSLNPGILWTSNGLLYIGVALLGFRIDTSDLLSSGWVSAGSVIVVLIATIAIGYVIARRFGQSQQASILMAGAVAICGASAAAALCATMPRCENRDRELAITIAGITCLSTLAMFFYPIVAAILSLTDAETGLFLGGSIHNVSQAVGAGYSVSDEAGDLTVILKMLRVAALVPVIFLVSYLTSKSLSARERKTNAPRRARVPLFLIVFTILAVLSCLKLIPPSLTDVGNHAAKWALIISMVAIGMRTSLHDIFKYGKNPLIVMLLTTLFMGGVLLTGILIGRYV